MEIRRKSHVIKKMNGKTDVSKRKRVVVLRKYGRSKSHQSLQFTFLKMEEKSQVPHIFP
jgi:hypothetical protein